MIAPRRAAVLGSPISHSLSPALHRAAYLALGLDWTYDAIEVSVAQFPRVLDELRADETVVGLSLTMPLKEVALDAADVSSDLARRTHAANTLVFRGGTLEADNTDPQGIVWALSRAGVRGGVQRAGIVGAGATARSSLAALQQLGVTEVHAVARRAEAIADLRKVADSFEIELTGYDWEHCARVFHNPVVISTTPKGVADGLIANVPTSAGVLLDVVYSPWPTTLAMSWQAARGLVVSGLEMLVGQAGRQVELMTGQEPPLDAMLAAGREAMGR